MSPVTEEDVRRIREKYGDLLDKIEEEREPLSGKQCLDLLPPEAPRSGSIFTSGFYFNGRGIKYRTALGIALIPYRTFVINLINLILLKIFLVALAVEFFRSGEISFSLFIFFWGYMDIITNVILRTFPNIEIDLNHKKLRIGRIFITEIPFSKIEYIEIHQMPNSDERITGTCIFLKYLHNRAEIAVLHTWEEDDCLEIIQKSLMCLLGKELEVHFLTA